MQNALKTALRMSLLALRAQATPAAALRVTSAFGTRYGGLTRQAQPIAARFPAVDPYRALSTSATPLSKEEAHKMLLKWSELNREGMSRLKQGSDIDLEEAERLFREASQSIAMLGNTPYKLISNANLASCLLRRNRAADAIVLFNEALSDQKGLQQLPLEQVATLYTELASAQEALGKIPDSISSRLRARQVYLLACEKFVNLARQALTTPSDNNNGPTREQLITNAINTWRGAASCEFAAAVMLYNRGDFNEAVNHLKAVIADFKYFMESQLALTGVPFAPEVNGVKKPLIDADSLPLGPPNAPAVTFGLLGLLPSRNAEQLKATYCSVASDMIECQRSLGSAYLDRGLIAEAGDCYVAACELAVSRDQADPEGRVALGVLAESSKALRKTSENIEAQYEELCHQDGVPTGVSEDVLRSSPANAGYELAVPDVDAIEKRPNLTISTSELQRLRFLKKFETMENIRERMRKIFKKHIEHEAKHRNLKSSLDPNSKEFEEIRRLAQKFKDEIVITPEIQASIDASKAMEAEVRTRRAKEYLQARSQMLARQNDLRKILSKLGAPPASSSKEEA